MSNVYVMKLYIINSSLITFYLSLLVVEDEFSEKSDVITDKWVQILRPLLNSWQYTTTMFSLQIMSWHPDFLESIYTRSLFHEKSFYCSTMKVQSWQMNHMFRIWVLCWPVECIPTMQAMLLSYESYIWCVSCGLCYSTAQCCVDSDIKYSCISLHGNAKGANYSMWAVRVKYRSSMT